MDQSSVLAPGQLLVVEDQAPTLNMLTRYLRGRGHAVSVAVDAEQALDCLQAGSYDAILCDVHMPGMSGLDFALQLCDDAPGCALILMTGDPDDRVEQLARSAGAIGYLRKPFSFSELDEILALVLDRP
jgi:DNA-binding response OmpR family regulator